ncbi:MAG TPA: chromosome condensation regulator RCC1 [Streptosporangiaceae bacterium]
MRILRGSRRLARVAGCVTLTLGAGAGALAGSGVAQARAGFLTLSQTAAVSWGYNGDGRLGTGTTGSSALYATVSGLSSGVVQVSAGYDHALAVTSDGSVWAWGNNSAGKLGNGTSASSGVPVRVMGLTGVTRVAAGDSQSLALRSDGTVWAWGANDAGQLGNGVTSSAQLTPVQVTGLTGVTQIAAGSRFSLALRSDGTVWAWGANDSGQLGNGTTASSDVPVRVTGLTQVTSIAAGTDSALATRPGLTASGTVVDAWGGNTFGQLGDGTQTNRLSPEAVSGIGAPYIAAISAGGSYCMVLGTDGSVWGWGENEFGQLGNQPSSSPRLRPVRTVAPGSGIAAISAGHDHTLALRSDHTALAWGDNDFGQLGNGVTTDGPLQVQVTGLVGVTQVAAGGFYSLAVHTVAPVVRI